MAKGTSRAPSARKGSAGTAGDTIVALRLSDALIARADALIPRLAESDIAAAGEVSRATVLRLCVMRGLSLLEESYPASRRS